MPDVFKDGIVESLPVKKGRGRKPIYPFRTMEVGQAFVTDAKLTSVSAAAIMFSKRNPGYGFDCKTMPDTRIKVVRTK
ncbi:MAG: hypothetical protein KGI54_15375 [Pseudomonadota bacterium]|nr:hypothetical protein [Pseudomonadota bacterium]